MSMTATPFVAGNDRSTRIDAIEYQCTLMHHSICCDQRSFWATKGPEPARLGDRAGGWSRAVGRLTAEGVHRHSLEVS
jgi:hypothetical protein